MNQHRHPSRAPLPHASRGIASPGGARRLLSQQFVLSLLLGLLVLAGTVSDWSFLVKPAYAAASSPARSTPPSLTFQKYLKESPHATQPPKGPPSPYPQPPSHSKPGKPLTPPPSAEPATMKPIDQLLSAAFLAG